MGGSILSSLGWSELVAQNYQEYRTKIEMLSNGAINITAANFKIQNITTAIENIN